jgi:NAD+ synthase
MSPSFRIAIAQLNPTVGAITANGEALLRARAEAARQGADLLVSSELALSGYPPEDLVLKPAFMAELMEEAQRLAKRPGIPMIIGAPWLEGDRLFNAALLLTDGKLSVIHKKRHLPNYGVFDEARIFCPGGAALPIEVAGHRLGVMICEDMWHKDVAADLAKAGAEMLIALNASPFEAEKPDRRHIEALARVQESGLPLIYVNQVGGQDELVFDGASFALDAKGGISFRAASWSEEIAVIENQIAPLPERLETLYQALVTGLRDYVNKNRFPGVLIGMSGGIDSALTAAIAVDALGAEKVHLVMMPSPFTSQASLDDAAECAGYLGARLDSVGITEAMGSFATMLGPLFGNRAPDITEENIQARIRGVILMGLSNKFGHMVVSTGNKSEMSAGYATLYGDMCGGYAVLKDVYKTTVFELCRWRNAHRPTGGLGPLGLVIPENIIVKPPSAELRPDQKDQDSLPPYDELDDILHGLIEEELPVPAIAARGHDEALVRKVWRMLDRAEYKRRQAAPGVKITRRAFGRDRRYPITNGFCG